MAYVTPITLPGNVMFAVCNDGKTRKVTTVPRGLNNEHDPRWHCVAEFGKSLLGGFLKWDKENKRYCFAG